MDRRADLLTYSPSQSRQLTSSPNESYRLLRRLFCHTVYINLLGADPMGAPAPLISRKNANYISWKATNYKQVKLGPEAKDSSFVSLYMSH